MMASKEQIAKYQEVYEVAKRAGVIPPEVIAAQWAVESSWGKSLRVKIIYLVPKQGMAIRITKN